MSQEGFQLTLLLTCRLRAAQREADKTAKRVAIVAEESAKVKRAVAAAEETAAAATSELR